MRNVEKVSDDAVDRCGDLHNYLVVKREERKTDTMSANTLSEFVEATATKFGIPGVAVGVWANGQETFACHGVMSIDNPLPIDQGAAGPDA